MKRFVKYLKDYFDLSNSERKGILVLTILIALIIIIKSLLSNIFKEKYEITPEIVNKINTLQKCIDSLDNVVVSERSFYKKQRKITPFSFNPSMLSESQWKKLGFDDYQIRVIKNFESKGGKFNCKEDFKKIYGISIEEYQILEPYILLPNKSDVALHPFEKKKINSIEINSADSIQLLELPGIGPAYSSRIIKYRIKIGGFVNINQILEIYGMDSVRFNNIKQYLYVDSTLVKKININKASIKDLMKCPYIDIILAKSIVNTRSYKGYYKKIEEIKTFKFISNESYIRIEPYLTVE